MKNKKQFTLIELIIVIVVIGILAAMALPKFNGVVKDARISAMIRDKETLEKTLIIYNEQHDNLPLLNEGEELIVSNEGLSLSKVVLAEEVKNCDMETIYKSLRETLKHYEDREDSLYMININQLKNSLSKNIKYGHKKNDKDFYVYSTKTGNVYYYDYVVNGNGTIQHDEYDTLLKENELVTKTTSPSLNEEETIINNKPIVELITNLENITTETIIDWNYKFIDEDQTPTKISFVLNDIEYDDFTKIPTKLNSGEYSIKLKMQDSKGLWSDEIIKTFFVEKNILLEENILVVNPTFSMKIGNDGNLYAWGRNNSGQLGIGNKIDQTTPQKVEFPNGIKPKSIYSGTNHSMAICDDGNLYSWGYNESGQLGIGNTVNQTTPQKVFLGTNIYPQKVFLNDNSSIIIGSNGNLIVFGENYFGQLGDGSYLNILAPKTINFPYDTKPIDVSMGNGFTMVLCADNNIYSFGSNSEGQLGINNLIKKNTPQKVLLPSGTIPQNVFSYSHTLVLTKEKTLYSWGYNYYGQSGIGNTTSKSIPQKISTPNNILFTKIINSKDFSIGLGEDNYLYTCGYNAYGQLGIGNTLNKSTFQKVLLPNGVKCKEVFSNSNNCFMIGDNNELYTWGLNSYGQLGIGNTINQTTPQHITLPNNEKPVLVKMNSSYMIALTDKGNLYGWGSNQYGQLGTGTTTNQLTPIKIELP